MSTNTKVCIIGAGAAGLCAARHLAQSSFQPVVYEQTNNIGGTWIYSETIGQDPKTGLPIHSSMYKSLRTNLPKEVMAFPDYPFPSNLPSFLHHTEISSYLKSYAEDFGVNDYIHLNNTVKSVVPCQDDPNNPWKVTVENVKSGETVTSLFKAIMICNGHYSVPSIPEMSGMESFTGEIMHSHDYRMPNRFKDKRVAVLGAAASGTDIGMEIASEAKHVFLCHNNPVLPSKLPDNFDQKKGITEIIGPKDLKLTDGSILEDIDVLLFCTGYHYSFPFLDEVCRPKVENRMVWPLYKHFVHIDYPSMCFIGIPIQICPFPQFDLQVQFFVKALTGERPLPSPEAMLEDTRRELSSKLDRDIPMRHFHKMGNSQWDYNRSLCKLANLTPIPLKVENLYNAVHERRRHHLTTYKKDIYRLSENAKVYERIA